MHGCHYPSRGKGQTMRLIDADALIEKYGEWYTEEGCEEGFIGTLKQLLDKQPTIEPKRGEWIVHFDDLFPEESTEECPVCHAEQLINGNDDNYCPNCGARLKGADDEID